MILLYLNALKLKILIKRNFVKKSLYTQKGNSLVFALGVCL